MYLRVPSSASCPPCTESTSPCPHEQRILQRNEAARASERNEGQQRVERLGAEQAERRAKYEAEDRKLLEELEKEVATRRRRREEAESQVRGGERVPCGTAESRPKASPILCVV